MRKRGTGAGGPGSGVRQGLPGDASACSRRTVTVGRDRVGVRDRAGVSVRFGATARSRFPWGRERLLARGGAGTARALFRESGVRGRGFGKGRWTRRIRDPSRIGKILARPFLDRVHDG